MYKILNYYSLTGPLAAWYVVSHDWYTKGFEKFRLPDNNRLTYTTAMSPASAFVKVIP